MIIHALNKSIRNSIAIFFTFFCLLSFSQTPDFKVQHLQDDVANSGGTNTYFTPISALSNAVELANNNRKTHAGVSPTNSSNRNGDDMAGARQLTSINALTYVRESDSEDSDMRFNTSIWEYIGPSSSANELIVRGRYAVNLNGLTNSVTQSLTGVTNANKCIPFITGIMNDASSQGADSGTALAYLENATTLRVQKGSNANDVTVYITVVEFTGSNWTVLHGDSGNTDLNTGTITIRNTSTGTGGQPTNVSSWSNAVIFSHFRADNTTSGINEAISDLWPITEPGINRQRVDWTFNSNHDSSGTNRHFIHVLVNSGLNVTRFQDTSSGEDETQVDITSAGLSDINQAFIVGSSISSGNGTAYGRGWRNYYLNSTTQAAHWAHRSGNTMSHEIQIIDLSGLESPAPIINVQGNAVDIPNGNTSIAIADDTDFGEVQTSGAISVSHTFTIENLGNLDLTLGGLSPFVTITGATNDFTLTGTPPSSTITTGGSTTFTITYDPTTSGTHTATISIASNDSDENPYTFLIQGSGGYCDSSGTTASNIGITNVSFNTINNSDIIKDNGYEDFTNISTNVVRDSPNDLSVDVYYDGGFWDFVYVLVWIDWNRDGDFDDLGEEYDMGQRGLFTSSPSTGPTSVPSLTISIPTGAEIGSTRMRVSAKRSNLFSASFPSSCEPSFDGEVEDYTINIIDNLIDFNGANGYINIADNHDLTGSFSLESWVFQESSVATGTIVSKGNIDASDKTGYHFSLKNNFPNLMWYDNSNNAVVNITSLYAIPNNEWHHIAATYDGTTVKLYVDGIEVNSAPAASSPTNTANDFIIGADTANFATTPLNYNYFDGAIQEVRIWDVALSETQIRDMMNQHIEDNTNVTGSETKLNISGGLLWSDLLGYYPLDSNNAEDSSGNNIDGIPQNIDSSQILTAPLPYKTNADNTWDTAATWLNNSDIYVPNSIGVDGSTTIDWNIVELSNDVSSGSRNITLLGLVSLSGTLTMDGTTDMNTGTGTGQSLTISHYLELDGVIDLEGVSQLLQLEGSVLDADSGGYIERDQQGTANGFNYNYWSSSVSPIGGNIGSRGTGIEYTNPNYTIAETLNDGTISSSYVPINFSTSYTAADSNTPSSPRTISSYWFYKFYGPDNAYNSWEGIDQNSSLLPGEGFTMKGTSGNVALSTLQNYVFKGLPNNGDISLPLIKSPGDVNRLIGNPYPSALNIEDFINDNISVAEGGTNSVNVFDGALYFWDHFGKEDSHVLGNYVGGYATRNLTGGVAAISNIAIINNNGAVSTKIPGLYVPVNQGFFVSTQGVDGGAIVFKNSQRAFVTESTESSIFLKSNNTKASNKTDNIRKPNPLIRLSIDSPKGYHRQIALGMNESASNGYDIGYDAYIADINEEDMYWAFNSAKFVIQGVNNFDETQEFDFGVIIKQAGITSINLDAIENLDSSLLLYIKDKVTGETHEINNASFQIYLEPGTYEDRFQLVFKPANSLSNKDIKTSNDMSIVYSKETSSLDIYLKDAAYAFEGAVINLLGQEISVIDAFENHISFPLNVSAGVYIVQIKTDKGLINKKILIN